MLTSFKLGVKIKKKRLSRMHLFMISFTFSHCHYWVKKCYFPDPSNVRNKDRTSDISDKMFTLSDVLITKMSDYF